MKVLVVGGGGREHTIVKKISESPKVDHIWCAPGNGGIASLAECVNIKATDLPALTAFCLENRPDLEGCLIYDENGEFKTWCSSGFVLEDL